MRRLAVQRREATVIRHFIHTVTLLETPGRVLFLSIYLILHKLRFAHMCLQLLMLARC